MNFLNRSLVFGAILTVASVFPVQAQTQTATSQTQPPAPCSGEEYRQLDFWVGEWKASWTNPNGSEGSGKNIITKNEYGDCVIYERFSMPGFNGMSVSTYHAPLGKWRQSWVDDQGGYFALTGGLSDEEGIHFGLENTRLSETAPYLRMIWQDVTEESFTWRWQRKADEASDWTDQWVINYSRMKSE